MSGLFASIVGQERALSLLVRALEEGASHAYLFTGPPGVGKAEAALAFAAGLVCAEAGCGTCDTCRRVLEGLHPDVRVVSPEANIIPIDTIREVVIDASKRPFELESRAKVYLFLEAHRLNAEAAGAFLKTLEEPPSHVHFILVSEQPDRLPSTILSRCQVVPFSPVPIGAVARDLREHLGAPADRAELWARAARGDLSYARDLATSQSARRQRERLLDLARDLPEMTPLDLESALDEVMSMLEKRAAEQAAELEQKRDQRLQWAANARERAWVNKTYAELIKRQHRRMLTLGLHAVVQIFAGWYRDLAMVAMGAEEAALNRDRLEELRVFAIADVVPSYLQAVAVARRARERLRYNVDARCAIGDMFRSIKEALA